MGREFELKYRADGASQAAIEKAFGRFYEIEMETTYYDSPEGGLSARHITLRRRLENGVAVCTLKTPAEGGARGEWEVEETDIEAAIPKLCKLSGHPMLAALTAGGVVPVCGARFLRKATTVETDGCTVELALDQGVLLGGGKEMPLCEVEVELKAGSQEAAIAFARHIAEQYGLAQEHGSKFRRALALARE